MGSNIKFNENEIQLLIDLVKNHSYIIENKKADGVSIKRKKREWEIIQQKWATQVVPMTHVTFDFKTSILQRSVKQLETKWQNMKARSKNEVAAVRAELPNGNDGSLEDHGINDTSNHMDEFMDYMALEEYKLRIDMLKEKKAMMSWKRKYWEEKYKTTAESKGTETTDDNH